MPLFATATLVPLALLALAGLGPTQVAGWAALAALLWMTALAATLDRLARAVPDADLDAEFPGSDALCVTLALGQLLVWALAIRALAGDGLGAPAKAALAVALALFAGQVGNANAHELIHRPTRALRRLGTLVYASILFGHHASAHPLVHHVHVATRDDPSTARLGESYWRFAPRAWRGSFRAGLRAERGRLKRAGRPAWRHPFLAQGALSAATLAVSVALGGWAGLAWHLGLATAATSQLLLSDYVQHYGLRRAIRPDGRPEPVGPRHSWNSPHPASSAMLLNAPRHSDHHAHPSRPYPGLAIPSDAPTLPRSLPVMACLALVPPLWRRVMDPRARAWLAQT